MENLRVLKHLAIMGGLRNFVPLSSGELAKMLGISQQSASKKILELIDNGIIERRLGAKKPLIKITKKGLGLLQKEYAEYQRMFEALKKLSVKGVVISGMGEGRYYLTLKGYKEQLKRKPRPFPKVKLNQQVKNIDDFKFEDITIENYNPHPSIKGEVTVVGGF